MTIAHIYKYELSKNFDGHSLKRTSLTDPKSFFFSIFQQRCWGGKVDVQVVLKQSGEKQIIEHLEILLHLDEFNAIFSSSFRLENE